MCPNGTKTFYHSHIQPELIQPNHLFLDFLCNYFFFYLNYLFNSYRVYRVRSVIFDIFLRPLLLHQSCILRCWCWCQSCPLQSGEGYSVSTLIISKESINIQLNKMFSSLGHEKQSQTLEKPPAPLLRYWVASLFTKKKRLFNDNQHLASPYMPPWYYQLLKWHFYENMLRIHRENW